MNDQVITIEQVKAAQRQYSKSGLAADLQCAKELQAEYDTRRVPLVLPVPMYFRFSETVHGSSLNRNSLSGLLLR